MPVTDDDGLRELLSADTIAVVGCSSTPGKAAHDVPEYLQRQGYEVIPVNPYADEVLGREAYDSLADVDEDIDLVDVFRPSEEVDDVIDDALAHHEERGDIDGMWLQLGIADDEALARAEAEGIRTTQDRCIMVDHRRLFG